MTVRLFARAAELAGADRVEVPDVATAAELRRALAAAVPELRGLIPSLLIAVDESYATNETAIPAGAEIAAFPPVSGG